MIAVDFFENIYNNLGDVIAKKRSIPDNLQIIFCTLTTDHK